MEKIDNNIIKDFNSTRINHKFLCNAPFASVRISTIYTVSPCCFTYIVDDYSRKSITEIFNGKIYKQYRKAIRKGEFPDACSACKNSLLNGEYYSAMIHNYDYLKVSRIFPNKIRHLNIALSNTCNLECIMCNGLTSSSIRKNRDKQEPINFPHSHRLRNEIIPLLPDMQSITFLGGEPFLIPIYYEIWEDITRINPDCSINVITNGTILNDRIKQLLDKGKFNINVSFNGISKEIYEAIHVNANFEETKANIMYIGNYMKKNNRILTIAICPLKLNKFEIPDIVRFCNQNNFFIDIQNVRSAIEVALCSSTEEELVEIKKFYQKQEFDETNEICKKNISEFNDLVRRTDHWIELAKRKKDFMKLFDLGTDKVDSFEKNLFNNLENTLRTICGNDNEAQIKLKHIQEKWYNVLTRLPSFFKSNHLYQELLCLGPSMFLEYFMYGNEDFLRLILEELFYYGFDHG